MRLLGLKPEECTGCRTCELICALHNFGENNPAKAALRKRGLFPAPGHYDLRLCHQCGECARACPTDTIYRREDGVYVIDPEGCTGCVACVEACPLGVMLTHEDSEVPIKCNACGECVTYCPKQLLALEGETGRGDAETRGRGDTGTERRRCRVTRGASYAST